MSGQAAAARRKGGSPGKNSGRRDPGRLFVGLLGPECSCGEGAELCEGWVGWVAAGSQRRPMDGSEGCSQALRHSENVTMP